MKLQRDPLYQQIAEILRRELLASAKPGDLLPTERALADRFAVSVLTVREALGMLVRDGAIARRRAVGTVVIDPTCGRHVAVVCELDLAHPRTSLYYRHAALQLPVELEALGLDSRLYIGRTAPGSPMGDDLTCPAFARDLDRGRICAVVAVPSPMPRAIYARLRATNTPVVPDHPSGAYEVCVDQEAFIRQSVATLVKRGHRRIACIVPGPETPATLRDAALAALARAEVEVRPEWVRGDQHPAAIGAGWENFLEIWSAHRDLKPDALVIADDFLAEDAAKAILALGIRVPERLAVCFLANRGSLNQMPFPVFRWEADPAETSRLLARNLAAVLRNQTVDPAPVRLVGQIMESSSLFASSAALEQAFSSGGTSQP